MNESDRVLRELEVKFPGLRVMKKRDSRFMKIINVLLMIITFGQLKTFMTQFATTIGKTIYVFDDWDYYDDFARAGILRHEGVHVAQFEKHGRIMFSLQYLLWPFPFLWATKRRDFEQEAYIESMRARAEYYGASTLRYKEYKQHLFKNFTTSAYFWMWPWRKQLEEWYESNVKALEEEFDD
jgi:hypothetical protein